MYSDKCELITIYSSCIFSGGKTGLSETTLYNRNKNQERFKSTAVISLDHYFNCQQSSEYLRT